MANPATVSSTSTNLDPYLERRLAVVVQLLIRSGTVASGDREDWEQDLRLAILESRAKFNAARSSWHTYANGVIHRTVRRKVRDMTAACRDHRSCVSLDQGATTGGGLLDLPDQRQEDADRREETADLTRTAIDGMSADARTVAQALMRMQPEEAIAHLGWPRWRFYRAKAEITRALQRAGLG